MQGHGREAATWKPAMGVHLVLAAGAMLPFWQLSVNLLSYARVASAKANTVEP